MPKGYIIAHIAVTDPEAYKGYIDQNTKVLEGLGGRFIVRGGTSQTVEGSLEGRHVVLEFPSYAEALAAYHDPAYQKIADIRRASSEGTIVVVEGT